MFSILFLSLLGVLLFTVLPCPLAALASVGFGEVNVGEHDIKYLLVPIHGMALDALLDCLLDELATFNVKYQYCETTRSYLW